MIFVHTVDGFEFKCSNIQTILFKSVCLNSSTVFVCNVKQMMSYSRHRNFILIAIGLCAGRVIIHPRKFI